LETLESSPPKNSIPLFNDALGNAVTVKEDIYIVGGYYWYGSEKADQIIRMNATSQSYTHLVIENNILPEMGVWLYAPTSVWVGSLNRIYYFGGGYGVWFLQRTTDKIWYVDLN